MVNYVTDRKRASGLGAGRKGTTHHWQMMVSSILLVPLVPLFVYVFTNAFGRSYEEVLAYFAQPFPAIVSALSLIVITLHVMHETLVAIEDYVHGVKGKLLMVATSAFAYSLIAVGLFALAKIAF